MNSSNSITADRTIAGEGATDAPNAPAGVRAALPGSTHVVALDDPSLLSRYVADWDMLARAAAEPNVFLEAWNFLPALAAYGAGKRSLMLLVYRTADTPAEPGRLIGFFPFEQRSVFKSFPLAVLRLWDHPQRFLGSPLVHRDHAREAWAAVIAWLQAKPRPASLVELPLISTEGAAYHAFVDAARSSGALVMDDDRFARAALYRGGDTDRVNEAAQANREWRRQRRRLGERGALNLREFAAGDDVAKWIDGFLGLEASGWKGREGTALAANAHEATYFRQIAAAAAERGQLRIIGLFLGDTPIAMKCSFAAGDTLFTYKMAYDEAYRAASPGVLLELDFIEAAARDSSIRMVDSCAVPGHPTYRRLWRSSRGIANLIVSPGSVRGNLALAFLACIRSARRSMPSRARQGGRHDRD